MSGGVDQVERVRRTVAGMVRHAHRMQLDGDAAFALEVVGVEHLVPHLPLVQRARDFQEPVGKRRLAVIDVRDYAEVADEAGLHQDVARRKSFAISTNTT